MKLLNYSLQTHPTDQVIITELDWMTTIMRIEGDKVREREK